MIFMKKSIGAGVYTPLIAPVFLMTMILMPLLFVMVKRYYSFELIPIALVNGVIMTGGLMLNIFVYSQLSGKVPNMVLYILILLSSAGFAFSGFLYISITNSLFFLYSLEVMFSYMAVMFLIITALSLLSSGFINYQRLIEQERTRGEEEKRLREEMERQIHSSRINPHFLFNSLNLMISLLDDKEKAEDVLIGLSELLRYNLDASKKKEISLSQELDSVRKYLFIQKERFGKRLDFSLQGDSECMVPPLIIQPLVENSIKHNMDKISHLEVTLNTSEEEGRLHIHVIDSEARLEKEMVGRGTGLEVTKRLIELNDGTFTIEEGGIHLCLPMK